MKQPSEIPNENIQKAIEWAQTYKGTDPIQLNKWETVTDPQKFLATQVATIKTGRIISESYRLIKKLKDAVTQF